MPDYRDFVKMARERQAKARAGAARGGVLFTRHAEYKMKQYGLSAQRVRAVIRNPRRREEGIAKQTVAVMQPPSVKRKDGQEIWTQEIWVMFQIQKTANKKQKTEGGGQEMADGRQETENGRKETYDSRSPFAASGLLKVISAWRYPGVSPRRNPVPEEILREIEEGSILEEDGII